MPPRKSIAWKFVEELKGKGKGKGKQWRCPYCKIEYSGGANRVRNHFRKTANCENSSKEGIVRCEIAPQHIRELMEWLPKQVPYPNKEDIAWKFVERLEDDKWRCHHCKEESFGDATAVKCHLLRGSSGGISICPEVPDTIRKLMMSLLEEAAEEEGREVNVQSSTELQSHDLPSEAQAEAAEVENRGGNGQSSMDISDDTTCIWTPGYYELLQQFLRTPLAGESSSQCEQSLAVSQWQTPIDIDPLIASQHASDSHYIEETAVDLQASEATTNAIGPSSSPASQLCGAEVVLVRGNISPTNPVQHPDQFHPTYGKEYGNNIRSFASQISMDTDPSIAPQHTSNSHNIEPTAVVLQVSEAATNAKGPSSSRGNGRSSTELQSGDLLSEAQAGVAEEESREGNSRFSMKPHSRDMPTQAVVAEEDSREAHRRFSTEMCEYLGRLQITSPGAADSSNFNQPNVIRLNSDQQLQAECQFHQCSTMPSRMQHSDGSFLHGSTGPTGSSESMSCSGEGECYLRNSPYHEERQMNDQQTPAGESSSQCEQSRDVGNSSCLQDCNRNPQLQTPMDLDPSIASQHASDSHYIEATVIDLQVSEVAMNAIGLSSSQASVPPQCQSVLHQSTNLKTADQNPTVSSSSWGVSPVTCHPPTPLDMVPCILSLSQTPTNALPPPSIPPCGTGVITPSSSSDMNEGAPMASHANTADNFEENGALKRKLEKLYSRVAGIRDELEFAASLSVKNQRKEVENWLPDAEKFIKDYAQAANKSCLPPQEVNKLKRKSEDLLRQGKFPKGLFEARETKVSKVLEGKMVGEAFKRNTKKILEYLEGNKVSRLGIYGMGGVGKTTIMKHIHNRLLQKANDDNVLWITMSKDFDTRKLQGSICLALGLGTLEEMEVSKRAAKLHDHLTKRGKCTLILDDVWEHFDLEELGIAIGADGFKLALTTRSFDVCCQMQCQENIKIEPLSQKEAESLFLEELGSELALSLEIKAVVKSIVEECAGLPLGVITIARSMRGVTQLFKWKDFLAKLKESSMAQTDMEKVLMKLKFSYDRLGNSEVQKCFLSCALYPEDFLIDKLELIELFIDQGLIGGLDTREQQYDRGLTILSILENVCLLEDYEEEMKMHDLIRDMALDIINATSMVKARKQLRRIPSEERWTNALERVSLMHNVIREFPLDMSPNCPKLSTLLLNYSLGHGNVIPDCFFERLRGLEYLNLSGCLLTELPNSISDLVNLRALLLRECRYLCHIPCIRKLTSLRKLDAKGCENLQKIEGLEMLVNLRYLDLYRTRICRFPKGTFRDLLKLQYLKVIAPIEEDITNLVALETVECYFGRIFGRPPLTLHSSKSFSGRLVSHNDSIFGLDKMVVMEGLNHAIVSVGGECAGTSILIPRDVQSLTMTDCNGTTNLAGMGPLKYLEKLTMERDGNLRVLWGGLDEEGIDIHDSPATTPSPPLFPSLRLLDISRCPKLKYLFGYGSKFSLPHLQEIDINYCEEMVGIMATVTSLPPTVTSLPPCPNPAFPRLEKIYVGDCDKMKRVVESEWLPHFPSLREITVDYCENMEEIMGGPPRNMTVEEIPLKCLSVKGCDKMRMLLTREWLIHLRNLQRIRVDRCRGMVEMISSGAGQSQEGSTRSEAGQSQRGIIMTPVTNTSFRSSISLPKLTCLHLYGLPRLQSICEVSVTCDSIENIRVCKCPELKGIPLQLRLRDIKDLPYIWVEDEQKWKMLTWDHPDAQAILQPYLLKGVEANKRIGFWRIDLMSPTAIELPAKEKDVKWPNLLREKLD